MWSKIGNAEIIKKGDKFFLIVEYKKISELTNKYGPVDIQSELTRSQKYFEWNFPSYTFRMPSKDELIVVNLEEQKNYDSICVKRSKNDIVWYGEGSSIRFEAMNDHYFCKVENKWMSVILLPFPTPYRRPENVFHHEVGHWFFDRMGDQWAKELGLTYYDNLDAVREHSIVESFGNCSEMAALHCEDILGIKIVKNGHPNEKELDSLEKICNKYRQLPPLAAIKTHLEEKRDECNV